MTLTRREFTKSTAALAAGAAVSSALELTGCNLETDILNYSKVGKAAFDSVVAMLEARGVLPAGGNQFTRAVDAAFDAVAAAVAAYQAGNGTGTLAEISAALAAVTAAISTFLGELNIPEASLLSLVLALVQIILETIAGFVSKLPAPPAPPITQFHTRRGDQLTVEPRVRTVRQFKRDWNAAAAGHAELQLKLTFWEHL